MTNDEIIQRVANAVVRPSTDRRRDSLAQVAITAYLAALDKAGWQVVPKVPPKKIRGIINIWVDKDMGEENEMTFWQTMLEAAPKPPGSVS